MASHQRSDKRFDRERRLRATVKANSTTRTSGDNRKTTNNVPMPRPDECRRRWFIAAATAPEDRIANRMTASEEPSVTNDMAAPIGQLPRPPNCGAICTPIMLTLPPTSCGVR